MSRSSAEIIPPASVRERNQSIRNHIALHGHHDAREAACLALYTLDMLLDVAGFRDMQHPPEDRANRADVYESYDAAHDVVRHLVHRGAFPVHAR